MDAFGIFESIVPEEDPADERHERLRRQIESIEDDAAYDDIMSELLEPRSHLLILPALGVDADAYTPLAKQSGIPDVTVFPAWPSRDMAKAPSCIDWPDQFDAWYSSHLSSQSKKLRTLMRRIDAQRIVVFAHSEGTVLAHLLGLPAVTMAGLEVDAVDSVVLDTQLDPSPSFRALHCADAAVCVVDVDDLLARDAWPLQKRTIRVQMQASAYSCLDADSAARAEQSAHDVRGRPKNASPYVDAVGTVAAVLRAYDRACRGLRAI